MEESEPTGLTPGELRRLREEHEFESAALANRGKVAVNAEAYGPDAKPIGTFEVVDDSSPRPPKDAYLGDRIESIMQPENVSISGSSSSGRRSGRKKNGNPTESQKRQAQIRSDQEYELLRPRQIGGRVSEEAFEALHSDPTRAPGILFEALGRAILSGKTFDDVLASLHGDAA